MSSSDRGPGWALHARRGAASTLVYDLAARAGTSIDGSDVPPLEVSLPPALTGFVLALFAARALDERRGEPHDEPHGEPHDEHRTDVGADASAVDGAHAGARSLTELGRLLAAVPGPGNPVEADTVGGYKRGLARRVRAAVRDWQVRTGSQVTPEPLVVQPGYGRGYALGPRDLVLDGLDVEALLAAVDAVDRAHRPATTGHVAPRA